LGTTLATVEGTATRFTKLTAFGQPLKLPSNIPSAVEVTAEMPALPGAALTEGIQQTSANP